MSLEPSATGRAIRGEVKTARRWRRFGGALLHSIGLVLFTVLVVRYWPGIRNTWTEIHWGLLALSCALVPVEMAFRVQRFRLLVRQAIGPLSYRFSYLVYLAGYFIGVITPGRIGEFAKVHYLMAEKRASAADALRPTLVDRLFDLLFLVVVGAVGWAVLGLHRIEGVTTVKIVGFAAVGIAAVSGPIWGRMLVGAVAARAGLSGRVTKMLRWLEAVLASFYTRTGAECSSLTLVAYAIGFFQALLIARSVGIQEIPYLTMCVIMAAISMAMLIPISVSGFGTREASAIFLMGQMYGVPEDRAISFSLLYFFVFNVFGGLVGLAAWLMIPVYRRKGLRDLATLEAELDRTV